MRKPQAHLDKIFRKAIMKRSLSKHKTCRITEPSDTVEYGKEQNVVVKLNKERKCKYFHDTNIKKT